MDNPALNTALKAFSSLTKEQKAALSRTLEGFVASLAPSSTDPHANPHARTVITEEAWENRANWDRDEWNAWETWGWYRQFCRVVSIRSAKLFHSVHVCSLLFPFFQYAPYLRSYSTTLYTISFSKFDNAKDPAADLLKLIWNVATGQES